MAPPFFVVFWRKGSTAFLLNGDQKNKESSQLPLLRENTGSQDGVFLEDQGGPVSGETMANLRRRLNIFKESLGDELIDSLQDDEDNHDVRRKRGEVKKRDGTCIDTIVDGSFTGIVLAACLATVLGAAFFAYKNLYQAVMKKMYPVDDEP